MSTNDTTEARERLALAVEQMADSENFAAWLRARASFHSYSFNNVLLIACQRPDATRVAGYRAWQKLDRQVRKGEKAIRILAPCRVKVGETESATVTESAFRVVGFKWASVFDVSQTDGPDLPELEYAPLEGEAPDLADFLCGVAMAAGVEIRREPLQGGMHGYLRRSENLIVVDSAGSGAMSAKVVAHELGHLFDPWLIENPDAYAAHRGDCEAVAEACAFVLCAKFGLDAGPSAVGYVCSWTDGNADRVRDLAERIDAAVVAIIGRDRVSGNGGE
jgi:antirestriction protein ArdC